MAFSLSEHSEQVPPFVAEDAKKMISPESQPRPHTRSARHRTERSRLHLELAIAQQSTNILI